jgi:ABC-type multidrug transport system fused ATPase/permease subunit
MKNIFKIYFASTDKPKIKLFILIFLIFVVTVFEAIGIGMLIPLLTIFVRDLGEIKESLKLISDFPVIYDYLFLLNKKQMIYLCLVLIILIYFLKSLIVTYFGIYSSRFVYKAQASISNILFNNYLSKPYNFHLNKNSSELIRNITSEVGVFVGSILLPSIYILTETMVALVLLSFLFFLEPVIIFSVTVAFLTIMVVMHFLGKNFLKKWGEIRQEKTGLLIKNLQEGLGAIKEIKILGIENEFSKNFQKQNYLKAAAESNMMAFQQIPKSFLEFFAILFFVILVFAFLYANKAFVDIIPILGIFAATAFRALPSANRIMVNLNALRYGLPVLPIIVYELDKVDKNNLTQTRTKKKILFSSMKLKEVSFKYSPQSKPILEKITLNINAGEKIAFTGPSGSGKSTLIDLICGLLEPTAGEILINQKDIKESMQEWQNVIGYVSQSPYLIDDSLKKNIAFGLNDAEVDNKKIMELVNKVQLGSLVENLSNGINTLLGEKGVRLSGGQKQRIAIARALYRDCQILVLDEATSALDGELEEKILNSLNELKLNKTLLVISHRKSSLERCDKIFKFNNFGKISEILFKDL